MMSESSSSKIIAQGMHPEIARRRIAAFRMRFKEPHFYFAQHAAFSLALTPDLLYRLWANFQRDIDNERLKIPWLAVSDLLLSPLCEEIDVGYELYEMDVTVRAQLLSSLQTHPRFGKKRIDELAFFLQDYARQQFNSTDPTIREIANGQRWTALSYIQPDETSRELKETFEKLQKGNEIEQIRLASLMETFGQLAEPFAALEGFIPTLTFMQKRISNISANTNEVIETKQGNKEVSGMNDGVSSEEELLGGYSFKIQEKTEEMRQEKWSIKSPHAGAVTILLCYAPKDRNMANKLKNHLSSLERQKLISIWDGDSVETHVETEWKNTMDTYFNEAQIILLFISSSFLASEYCYSIQMQRAIKRHEKKEARVIPLLLRPTYWKVPPLDKLQALPENNKFVSEWTPQDAGFTNIVMSIATIVKQWKEQSLSSPTKERKELIANIEQLIESVKSQLQPQPRTQAIAHTLQQLSIFIPVSVTLADLIVGWRSLSQSTQEEDVAIVRRRVTCGELADLASQFTNDQGSIEQAIETWQAWQTAFEKSDDPRQSVMARTFEREMRELQGVDQ